MNNTVVGIGILGLMGLLVYVSMSDTVILKEDIPQFTFPKNSYTDSVGNTIDFFLPPEGNFTQQMSDLPFGRNLALTDEPEIVQVTEVSSTPTNSTKVTLKYVDTSPVTLGIQKGSYSGLTKIITSDASGGITKVKRGEIAVIIGQIKLFDKMEHGEPVYLNGPFVYHLLIECCEGDVFIYSNRPTPTDNNGYFTISYTTNQKNILGTYKVTLETEDKFGKPIKHTTTFELVP